MAETYYIALTKKYAAEMHKLLKTAAAEQNTSMTELATQWLKLGVKWKLSPVTIKALEELAEKEGVSVEALLDDFIASRM